MACCSILAALLCSLLLLSRTNTAHGWWPFSSTTAPTADAPSKLQIEDEEPRVQAHPARFEVINAEQKFLAEAQKYLEMSPLEKCQHAVRLLAR